MAMQPVKTDFIGFHRTNSLGSMPENMHREGRAAHRAATWQPGTEFGVRHADDQGSGRCVPKMPIELATAIATPCTGLTQQRLASA